MTKFIHQYFTAERSESVLFLTIGLVAVVAAAYFWAILKTPFVRGCAWPLLLIGLIHITVGYSVFVRSPKDISRVEQILKQEPAKIYTEELPRMETVMKNFVIYRYVEIALALLGLVLAMVWGKNNPFLRGLGLGLVLMAGITLALDFFAERRGFSYIKALKENIRA
jgi:hypothetical protein